MAAALLAAAALRALAAPPATRHAASGRAVARHAAHRHAAPRQTTPACSLDLPEETAEANRKMHQLAVLASEALYTGYTEVSGQVSHPMTWRTYSFPEHLFDGVDAQPPYPFQIQDLARLSLEPLLSPEECASIIREADADVIHGWRSAPARYGVAQQATGRMIPVEELSWTFDLLNQRLQQRLLPNVVAAFPHVFPDPATAALRIQGARLVKYDAASGHVELGYHRDGTLLTANIALNAPTEFEGGGTLIEALLASRRVSICPQVGHVLLHPGNLRHAGLAITAGVRYVMVIFLMDANLVEHDRYCLQRGEEELALTLTSTMAGSEARRRGLESSLRHFADACACGARIDEAQSGAVSIVEAFKAFGIDIKIGMYGGKI